VVHSSPKMRPNVDSLFAACRNVRDVPREEHGTATDALQAPTTDRYSRRERLGALGELRRAIEQDRVILSVSADADLRKVGRSG